MPIMARIRATWKKQILSRLCCDESCSSETQDMCESPVFDNVSEMLQKCAFGFLAVCSHVRSVKLLKRLAEFYI
jgi:hypothetical protein